MFIVFYSIIRVKFKSAEIFFSIFLLAIDMWCLWAKVGTVLGKRTNYFVSPKEPRTIQ